MKVAWSQESTENNETEKNWSRAFFFLNSHLHSVDTITATIDCLSQLLCTYPSTYSVFLTVNRLFLGYGRGRGAIPLTLILVHGPHQMRYVNESKEVTTFRELVSVLIRKQILPFRSLVTAHENQMSVYCYSLTHP